MGKAFLEQVARAAADLQAGYAECERAVRAFYGARREEREEARKRFDSVYGRLSELQSRLLCAARGESDDASP